MKRIVLLATLAACGGGSSSPPDALPTTLGGDRPVKLQVPPNVEPGKTYPLVLVLHGYGVDGYVQQRVLQLATLPADHGAFVLAPDGTIDSTDHRFWNADPVCCNMDGSTVDDVAYLGGLLDTVIAERPIDRSRVFVVGHSNGAFMAYRLACDRSDVVTAIAGLAGAASSTASNCNPTHPVAILHMHGTLDDMIPYDGADLPGGLHMPGAIESVTQWAGHDACTGARSNTGMIDVDQSISDAETTTSSFAGCPTGAAVELWTIAGAGHVPDLPPAFEGQVWGWLDAHARP